MIVGCTTIEAVMAEYAQAVLDKAPARLAALYAPNVRVFDAWGVWSFEDQGGWRRSLEEWLGSLGDETVRVQFDQVRLGQYHDAAFMSAFVTYNALDTERRVTQSMPNRLSWSLIQAQGHWLIAHEHTSAPIDFATQKAILNRS